MSAIKAVFNLVMTNKGKIFFALFSTFVFLFILFPFDDLSDLVSTQVSKVSGNAFYLQFQKLKMSLMPTPGLKMEKVFFQASNAPSVSLDSLTVTPSLSGLIYKKPYGQISIHGAMKGDVDLTLSKGPRTEGGAEREKLEVRGQKFAMKDITEFAKLPVQIKGQLQFASTAVADMTWKEQPEADVDLTINQFELPPASVPTPLGPLNLPEFKLGQVFMKGRLSAGNFNIEKGTLGKETDEIHGTVKGSLGLALENRAARGGEGRADMNNTPIPVFGSYTFDIEFTVKKSFQDRASAFLVFIDAYRSSVPEGAVYRFKISGNNFSQPPTLSALR
jgi:type II secretion system protein N